MISGGCLALFAASRNSFLENVLPTTIHTSRVVVGSRMMVWIFCHTSLAVPAPIRILRLTTCGIFFQLVRHLPAHRERFGGSTSENGVRISRFFTAWLHTSANAVAERSVVSRAAFT